MKDKKAVTLHSRDLVNEIRDFCKSQVDQWRLVPWLASEANGRSGYDGRYTAACVSGIWLVRAPTANSGTAIAYVDLLTGELIDTVAFHKEGRLQPIKDIDVLPFALVPDALDASAVVNELRRGADKPYAEGVDTETTVAWRQYVRTHYGVKPVYDETAIRRTE